MKAIHVVHWNVFEDGLTDSPASVGFTPAFDSRFSALLLELSRTETGDRFHVLGSARDFSQLPPVIAITSTASFVASIDLLYNALYHVLGGEARFEAYPHHHLVNSLRTLFLHSTLEDTSRPPSSSNRWMTTAFEAELEKAVGAAPCSADAETLSRHIQRIRETAFDSARGSVTWDRKLLQVMWKRSDNILRDRIAKDFSVFIAAGTGMEPKTSAAMSRFLHVRHEGKDAGDSDVLAIAEIDVDGHGELLRIRSLTFQAAMWRLLERLCQYSSQNPAAEQAIRVFAGVNELPPTIEEKVALIFAPLLKEVQSWYKRASLPVRHAQVCRTLEQEMPHIVTLVEYDAQWRRLAIPTSRNYAAVRGSGTASILFDNSEFERLLEIDGVVVPGVARSDCERGVLDGSHAAPKSSCLALLRHREKSALVLVGAVHLESGPPSSSDKVILRRDQLRALLAETSLVVEGLHSLGHGCSVIIGGDFNAVREEFVFGNGAEFYSTAGVAKLQPPLRKPRAGTDVQAPHPPLARLADDGSLHLFCGGIDGGELRESSRTAHDLAGKVACTRAGNSMVIDFVLTGRAGGGMCDVKALELVAPEESAEAADPEYGIHAAVLRWGSDHLPVGCVASL